MVLNEAKKLALELMEQNELISKGWVFQFDSSVRRFGGCYLERKIITLSAKLVELNIESEVKDTILHEIAHALAPSHEEAHGEQWKQMCSKIGARPERCYDSRKVVKPVMKKYTYICLHCNRTVTKTYRFIKKYACGACCRELNNGEWLSNFILVPKQ